MRLFLPLLLLVAFALPAGAQTDPAACTKSGAVISCNVQLHEVSTGGFHVLPERIDANPGDTLKMHVVNQGQATHNLVVCGDGKAPSSTCNDKWAFTGNMGAGESKDVTVDSIPKSGTFYYFCTLPGHAGGGMSGELKVQGSADKNSPGTAAVGALLALTASALLVGRRR